MIRQISARKFKVDSFDQKLTGRDIFVGGNGVGKSARLQAIMIALVGYIPNVGKLPNATMGYALDRKMELELKSDSITINRIFRKKTSRNGKVSFDSTTEILPLSEEDSIERIEAHFGLGSDMIDISEFIKMTSSQRKNFVTTLCSKHIKESNVKVMLSSVCNTDLWNDDMSDIDNLNAIETYYKNDLSVKKKELKATESHRNQLRAKLEANTSRSTDDIEKEMKEVEDKIESLTKDSASIDSKAEAAKALQSQIKQLDYDINVANTALKEYPDSEASILKIKLQMYKDRENAEAEIKKRSNLIDNIQNKIQAERERYIQLKAEYDLIVDLRKRFSDANCPFVKKICPESDALTKYITESESHMDDLSKKIKACEAAGKKSNSDMQAAEKMIESLKVDLSDKDTVIKSAEDKIAWHKNTKPGIEAELKKKMDDHKSIQTLVADMNIVAKDDFTSAIAALKSRRVNLQGELKKVGEAKNFMVESERVNMKIDTIEEAIEKANEIIAFVVTDLKAGIVKKIHKPLVDELNKVLKCVNEEAVIMIERDNKDVFDICLKKSGGVAKFEVLNTGHQVILATAFIIALQKLSEAKCKVILIEATDLNDKYFGMLLSALDEMGKGIDNVAIARLDYIPTQDNLWEIHELND